MDLSARRLAAVVAKTTDITAGPTFVFALKSSDTFCCPDCTDARNARITKRTSMDFFDNAAQALEAGLKPCATCSPDISAIPVGERVINSTVSTVNASLGIQPTADHHHQLSHSFPNSPDQNSLLGDNSIMFTGDEIPFPSPFMSSNAAFQRAFPNGAADLNSAPGLLGLHDGASFSAAHGYPGVDADASHHHRSASITTGNNHPTSIEALGWRPRRASIANGHIPAAAAVVDQMLWSGQYSNDLGPEASTVSSPEPSFHLTMDQFSVGSNDLSATTGPRNPHKIFAATAAPAAVTSAPTAPPASTVSTSAPRPSKESSSADSKHRGEGDHARLVDQACRSIAAAAAAAAASAAAAAAAEGSGKEADSRENAYSLNNGKISITRGKRSTSTSSAQALNDLHQPLKLQRKKRRGGILGFKELAAKAGLSPWHFHRVFRSVTGLTPKAYGEACWNAVIADPSLPVAIANGTATPPLPVTPKGHGAVSSTASPAPEKFENPPSLSHASSLSSVSQQMPINAPAAVATVPPSSPFELSAVPTLGSTPSDTNSSLSFGSGIAGPVVTSGAAMPTSSGIWTGITPASAAAVSTAGIDIAWNSPTTTAGPGLFPAHSGPELVSQLLTTMAPSTLIPGTSGTPVTSTISGTSSVDPFIATAPMTSFDSTIGAGSVVDDLQMNTQSLGQQGGWSLLAGNPFNMQPVTTPIPHQFNIGTSSGVGTPTALDMGHKSTAASPHPGVADQKDLRQWELADLVTIG